MKLLLGNEAIARGAYEAGCTVATAYPGTPSTEITENIAKLQEIYVEWSPNEKVAYEVAVGSSIKGARSMVCMKHVGANVAADPMFTFAYTGVNGGFVMVVADDPAMHSSQNEQDSRYYAMSSHTPMLEPSDSSECKEFTKRAFEISEEYDTPVMLRITTRVAHSQSLVELEDRIMPPSKSYEKNVFKYTMMPSNAKLRHIEVEKREIRLAKDVNNSPLNKVEYNSKELGIVCSGVIYQYVKEALPNASIFKMGMVYPMPIEAIREFANKVDRLIVIEELEPIFERELKANGIVCEGKNLFSVQGEITVKEIKKAILGQSLELKIADTPVRPPVMCAGCPHRPVFYVLSKLKLTVTADIGCYTLGAQKPLSAVDTVVCMGASIGMCHGFIKAGYDKSKVVAVIGDSTFVHSGITGLIDTVYNKGQSTVIILDNSTTGMTGHQNHPATGKTIRLEQTHKLDLELVCKACGVESVRVVDAYDINAVEKAIKEEVQKDEVSVIIAKRPCALLDKRITKQCSINKNCKKCGMCLKIGCPAISKNEEGNITINQALCVGCEVCTELCKFGAIDTREV